jgi:hypothetical protein
MPSSTAALAAVAALAGSVPAGSAPAPKPTPALAAPGMLAPSDAGHASLEGQRRLHRLAAARRAHQRRSRHAKPFAPVLQRIATCESHANPRSVGGGGAYRGAYQVTLSAWRSVGGQGDPASASMSEQTQRAARLLARSGTSPWPACGR